MVHRTLLTLASGWVKNTEMAQLDTDTVKDKIVPSMKGRLREAHEVASEKHDLQFFKDLLSSVAEARQQEENERIAKEQKAADKETKKAKSAEKKLATPAKKKSADNGPADGDDDDEDVEMADADLDVEEPKSKSKKRKADGDDVSAVSHNIFCTYSLLTNTNVNRLRNNLQRSLKSRLTILLR